MAKFRTLAYSLLALSSFFPRIRSMSSIEKNAPRWNVMWKEGIARGQLFDKGCPSPALLSSIREGCVPCGRALIPGMGRGYDVVALASPERYVLGVDISPTAVDEATQYILSLPPEDRPNPLHYKLSCESFFDLNDDEESKFDFVYDYTFLCALDPSIRADWANKMRDLVKQGGELFTLIYPIGDREGGPPFKVSLEVVKSLLEPVGFQQFRLEMLPPELCHPGRDGTGPTECMSGIGRWIKT